MFFNIPQFKNTPAEIAKIEEDFRGLSREPKKMQLAWQELYDFFADKSALEDRKYFYSLFRWYTDLTWKMLTNLRGSTVVEVACARQIPTAFLLDVDVHYRLLDYLGLRTTDDAEVGGWYSDMRNAFLTSEAIVGTLAGKNVTVVEVVEMVKRMQRPQATSIEAAEIASKIQTIFFVKDDPLFDAYFFANPNETVERFIDLVNFFVGVEPEKAPYVVSAYINPDRYENFAAALETRADESAGIAPQFSPETLAAPATEPVREKISYAEIKKNVEANFTKDATGQFLDPGAVFNLLSNLAEEYRDEKINDLYYFNESDGQFHWNDELLAL